MVIKRFYFKHTKLKKRTKHENNNYTYVTFTENVISIQNMCRSCVVWFEDTHIISV